MHIVSFFFLLEILLILSSHSIVSHVLAANIFDSPEFRQAFAVILVRFLGTALNANKASAQHGVRERNISSRLIEDNQLPEKGPGQSF